MIWNIQNISKLNDQILYKHPTYNTIIKTNNGDVDSFKDYLNKVMEEVFFMNNDMEKAEQYYEKQVQKEKTLTKITKELFINKQYDNIRDEDEDR